MSYQHGDPLWMELSTPDTRAACEFYSELFGWTYGDPDPDTGYIFAYVDEYPVAGIIELSQGDAEWRVYLQVDDISEIVSTVVRIGGRILAAPIQEGAWGKQAIIETPSGAVIGLWQPEDFKGFALGHEHGLPAWFELFSNNFGASLAFFQELVGWRYHFVGENGLMSTKRQEDSRFATNGASGDATAGIVDRAHEDVDEPAGRFKVYVAVDDVEEALEAARHNGGGIRAEERDNPRGRAVEISDPHGARLTVLQPREGV